MATATAADVLWAVHGLFPAGVSEMLGADPWGCPGLRVGAFWIRVSDVTTEDDRTIGRQWCVWTRDDDGEPIPVQEGYSPIGQEGEITEMISEMRHWGLLDEPVDGPADDGDPDDWHGQQDAYDARVYGGTL